MACDLVADDHPPRSLHWLFRDAVHLNRKVHDIGDFLFYRYNACTALLAYDPEGIFIFSQVL